MERSTSYNVEVYVSSPRFEFRKCYGTVQVRAREVATKTRQQPLSITLDKLLDVWWETVESGGRESALHSILLGFRSMEAVSDFVYNSPHLFRRYVFDVLRAHEFSMTISWKPRDHMDVSVWHAHSSNISDHPLRVHRLLKSLRDHANCLEVPSSFRDVPDPAMMLLRGPLRVCASESPYVLEGDTILVLR